MELSSYLKDRRKQAFKQKKPGDFVYYVNKKIKNNPIEKNLRILEIAEHWIICEVREGERTFFDMENGLERMDYNSYNPVGIIWPSKQYMQDEYAYADKICRLRMNLPFDQPDVIDKLIKVLDNPKTANVILQVTGETEEEKKRNCNKRKSRSRKNTYCLGLMNETNGNYSFIVDCEINEDVELSYTKIRSDASKMDFKEAIYVRNLLIKRAKQIWRNQKITLEIINYKTGEIYNPTTKAINFTR